AQHPPARRAAARERHPARAGRMGLRHPARLAVLARATAPPSAPLQLRRYRVNHLIGLLLGTETEWPPAFEGLLRRVGPVPDANGDEHTFDVERVTIEP